MNEALMSSWYGQMAEAGRTLWEPAVRAGEIAGRAQERLIDRQLALVETCLDAGVRQLELLADVRDPKDLVSRHTELAAEVGEKVLQVTQEALVIQVQARDELSELLKTGLGAAEGRKRESAKSEPKATKVARKAA